MSATSAPSAQLGTNLKRARAATGMTQAQVAEMAGLTQPHYAGLEAGRSSNGNPANPRLNTLLDLARALSTSVTDLIAGIE